MPSENRVLPYVRQRGVCWRSSRLQPFLGLRRLQKGSQYHLSRRGHETCAAIRRNSNPKRTLHCLRFARGRNRQLFKGIYPAQKNIKKAVPGFQSNPQKIITLDHFIPCLAQGIFLYLKCRFYWKNLGDFSPLKTAILCTNHLVKTHTHDDHHLKCGKHLVNILCIFYTFWLNCKRFPKSGAVL